MKPGTEQYRQRAHDNMIQSHLVSIHRTTHGLDIILDEADVLVREYADKIHWFLHELEVVQSSEQKVNEDA